MCRVHVLFSDDVDYKRSETWFDQGLVSKGKLEDNYGKTTLNSGKKELNLEVRILLLEHDAIARH